jgi:hypothetical protein
LETDRPYRLQLADGRCGQVIVSRIAADSDRREVLADFFAKTEALKQQEPKVTEHVAADR